jgi:tripeptidyl-peptidase-2
MRLALVCDETWVECPKHLYLTNSVRSFIVRVHADDLEEDKFHFAQIMAYDVDSVEKGYVFKIPISVVKPLM